MGFFLSTRRDGLGVPPSPGLSLFLEIIMAKSAGTLVRDKKGRFIKGKSGNPVGRPMGSKNVVTLQKLAVEEAFRADTSDNMAKVLQLVVMQALEGDKASQKLIWDANVSKQSITEDKSAGSKQEIKVRTVNIHGRNVIEGEFIDETNEDVT
jgi:D-alanyl-D-alanine dipeptidase